MKRDASKKFGNRMRPGWPQVWETARIMYSDGAEGADSETYNKNFEGIFGKKPDRFAECRGCKESFERGSLTKGLCLRCSEKRS